MKKLFIVALLALVCALSLPVSLSTATAFVQGNSEFGNFLSDPSPDIVFSSDITSGSVIAVHITWNSVSITFDSITDNQGNSYTIVENPTTGTGARCAGAYAWNATAGATTLEITFSAAPDRYGLIIHEISGADTSSDPFDVSAAQFQENPGTGTDAVSSGAAVTTEDGDYIFGATAAMSFGDSNMSAGTGFSQRENPASSFSLSSEDQIQASQGSIAATFTTDGGEFIDFETLMMSFKEASAGGVGITGPIVLTGPVIVQ